jgi:hypothetical protein
MVLMFTLVFFTLVLAGIVLSAHAAAQRPLPLTEALPVGLMGLTWRRLGERNTSGGTKLLWIGDGDATAYSRLYRSGRDELRALGFSWGGEVRGVYDRPVCWERVPAPVDLDYVAGCQRADAYAREEDARRAVIEAERVARVEAAEAKRREQAEQEREERIAAVELLRQRMRELPWAWTRSQRDRAADVLAERDEIPSEWAAKAARKLVETCDAMVKRVTERAQTERRQEWWELAADPVIQADVHVATKILSERDEDWATLDNNSGWSKAHTNLGHVLAGLPTLGQTEASQALWAVWAHRKQLQPDMRRLIFGDVETI